MMLAFAMSGCKVTKNFTPGQTLLTYNRIKFINEGNIKSPRRSREDLLHVAAQQPNKKVFNLMPFKLWLYTAANKKKETKLKWWIKNQVGEPPAIYDPELADKSNDLMMIFLQNSGYQYAKVTHDTITKKRRTIVTYSVTKGPLWRFGTVAFQAGPYLTDSITAQHMGQSKLRTGDKYDVTTLKAERDRIEADLRNKGFFFFGKEYIAFDLDTNKQPLTVNAVIRINQPSDSVVHQQFRINDLYITSDFGAELSEGPVKRDTFSINEFHFLSHKKIVKPSTILDCIFLSHDQLYSKENYTKTVRALANLIIFKFVTVDYVRVPGKDNYLNCIINLSPGKRQAISAEGQANISQEGYFGVSGLLSYKDKNLTGRSDLLAIDFVPSVQFTFGKHQPVGVLTEDYAPTASYYFNKIVIPWGKKLNLLLKDKAPKTRISIKYNYEHRNDFDNYGNEQFFYDLHGFNASYGYEWNRNTFIRHILAPINFTIFLLPREGPYFVQELDSNPLLKSSYEPQIIFGPSYTFTYTNQRSKFDKKYMFFRTSLETAGNILMAGYSLANIGKGDSLPYKILDKEFSEYVRGEFDLRGYYRLGQHALFAARSFFGIAIPYGNSTAVPFTKQFSVGGPTSLRGFEVREIGPGGYLNPLHDAYAATGFFDQTGDIKMEGNAEVRFDIFKWFKGAVFTDVGNVWLLQNDPAQPLGNFEFNRFWREFAIDVGPGLRLDFSYFVVRLDYGIPIRNPSIPGNDKWSTPETNLGPGVFQLAVGYPF
jgi:outer membrane protein assembly factor BamA